MGTTIMFSCSIVCSLFIGIFQYGYSLECNKCKHEELFTTNETVQSMINEQQTIDYNCLVFNSSFLTGEVVTCDTACFASVQHSISYLNGHIVTAIKVERGCSDHTVSKFDDICHDFGQGHKEELEEQGYTNVTAFLYECFCFYDHCTDGTNETGRIDLSQLEMYKDAEQTQQTEEPSFVCHQCRHFEFRPENETDTSMDAANVIDRNCLEFGEDSNYTTEATVGCHTACFASTGTAEITHKDGSKLTMTTAVRGCSTNSSHSNETGKCLDYGDTLKNYLLEGYPDVEHIEASSAECFCTENECNDGKSHKNGLDIDELNKYLNTAGGLRISLIEILFLQICLLFIIYK